MFLRPLCRAVLETIAVVAGLDDMAVMGQAVQEPVVIFGSPNTLAHSEKLRLVVIMTLVRS